MAENILTAAFIIWAVFGIVLPIAVLMIGDIHG